jgi:hypothetical protein
MLPSQLGAGIDKLVALFATAVTPVPVYDGPQVGSGWPEQWVVVGGDGPVDEEEDAGRVVQSWNGLGAKTRTEDLTIPCALGSSTGASDTSMKARRDAALALLAQIETALRADPGLGNFTTGGAAAMSEMAMKYVSNTQGLAVVLTFNIDIPVRI